MPNTEPATRFPLTWPEGWPRTPTDSRRRAQFGTKPTGAYKRSMTVASAIERLSYELGRIKARDELLSTNIALRLDGLPRSEQSEPRDPGVAVYFQLEGQPRVLACDKWTRVADNITAIAAHLEAMRAQDRYGVGTLAQAFAGYAALPPTGADWAIVLGVSPSATADEIDTAFRTRAREAHPDRGGSHADMARLNAARDHARKARG